MVLLLVEYAYFRKRNRCLSHIIDALIVLGIPSGMGMFLKELSPPPLVWVLIVIGMFLPVLWFLVKTDKIYSQLPD